MKKIVLCGGPSTGKTSTIKALENEGFNVCHEAARMVINEGYSPTENVEKFQERVIKKRLAIENDLNKDIVFLDRGVFDAIGYYQLRNLKIPKKIKLIIKEFHYDKVFILEPTGVLEKDGVRFEDEQQAIKVHELIRKAYQKNGYELISVPPMSVKERVEFIKKNI